MMDLGLPITMDDLDVVIAEKFDEVMGIEARPLMPISKKASTAKKVLADSMSDIMVEGEDEILKSNPVFQL